MASNHRLFDQTLLQRGELHDLSVSDKLLYLYLWLGTHNNWVGLFDFYPNVHAHFFNERPEAVRDGLRRLAEANLISYDESKNTVFIFGFTATQRTALKNPKYVNAIVETFMKYAPLHPDKLCHWFKENEHLMCKELRSAIDTCVEDLSRRTVQPSTPSQAIGRVNDDDDVTH